MIKLNIGISPQNIRHFYKSNPKIASAISVLVQHRVILNNKIVSYYKDMVPESEIEALTSYIDSIIVSEETAFVTKVCKESNSGMEEIIDQVKQARMKTLIAEADELIGFKLSGFKGLSIKSICDNDTIYLNSYLRKYSIPIVNYQIPRDADTDPIIRWFENMFIDEKKIVIQDAYIYTEESLKVLRETFCQTFSWKVTDLVIYGSLSESTNTEEAVKREFSNSFYNSWNVTLFDCSNFHPRCIQLETLMISLDASLDFLGRRGKTNKICRISVSKEFALPLENPRLICV